MNILLLTKDQLVGENRAILTERQQIHIETVLKINEVRDVSVGLVDGNIGKARVVRNESGDFELNHLRLTEASPKMLPFTLILALPRPQMLKRILQTVAIFGVERLELIHCNRVEKSFWQSPTATDEAIQEQLLLGLEQAKATQLPKVCKHKSFKRFIEEAEKLLPLAAQKYLAHPGAFPFLPTGKSGQSCNLVIGPEGGFNDYEVQRWVESGYQPVQFGERILKVETAVTALIARLI